MLGRSLLLVLQRLCISSLVFYIFVNNLCRAELEEKFPARGSNQVLLCLFPGALQL